MGTRSRRAARELALNVLYQVDVARLPPMEALHTALEHTDLDEGASEYASAVVHGVLEHLKDIDGQLSKLSVGWELQRQPAVDRNVLRMAMFEMLCLDYIPTSVSINEAVELVKKFSTEESGRFINGVLGTLARELESDKEGNENACSDSGRVGDVKAD
jgi:transcription antitermination protein NusB